MVSHHQPRVGAQRPQHDGVTCGDLKADCWKLACFDPQDIRNFFKSSGGSDGGDGELHALLHPP
jgi:hypothetical protein